MFFVFPSFWCLKILDVEDLTFPDLNMQDSGVQDCVFGR